ncbi:unnamed protein product [Pedinophyceae sp. YPF-701]|nr:unnamed protein product [Pedinophyceae sp. YPF-701]
MPTYNFKSMKVVPSAKDLIDIVLSKTQRQTPTVNHAGWHISRIRQFYMRKVKFTQQSWNERLSRVIEDFPKVDEIHPFYADLVNVLYDRDHYKLALGQVALARQLIDKLAQDYVRLLKYGDSQYRCKQLKRAALGRMCTLMKRQGPSLAYLEQVRQHMSRLPSIDPNTRTLLVCGYPNVGKSSFLNRITRADVEVQPYAFTTKSLYVGHTDYKYLPWQVIDTPGILDRPLEERNTIEMQSVTALAHLRAAVLYVVDVSERCGYSIAQQAALFHSIKPLFANKPVLVVCNKVDARPMDELAKEERDTLLEMAREAARISNGGLPVDAGAEEAVLVPMSTLTDTGVVDVKRAACDRLLASRVETKLRSKKASDVANRVHLALPNRDGAPPPDRPPQIPESVLRARAAAAALPSGAKPPKRRTERDEQEESGGAGVYSQDWRKLYQLREDDWRWDVIPEIMDGKNIADYVDPDIDARLEELEQEEARLAEEWEAAAEKVRAAEAANALGEEEAELLDKIKDRKKQLTIEHRRRKKAQQSKSVMPRTAAAAEATGERVGRGRREMEARGIDTGKAEARMRSQSRGRKRTRDEVDDFDELERAAQAEPKKRMHSKPSRSLSRGRSLSLAAPRSGSGLRDDGEMMNKAIRLEDKAQRKLNKGKVAPRRGEGDRWIFTKMPKHLFSGKRGIGKTDRR